MPLLNTADRLYAGSSLVSRVYQGASVVWQDGGTVEPPDPVVGVPQVVAAYPGDAVGVTEISVPNVWPGDWIVAGCGAHCILDPEDSVSFGGSGAGSWEYIGTTTGDAGGPLYMNYGMFAGYKQATGAGTYTVTVNGVPSDYQLQVLHLRGCVGIHRTPVDVVVNQNNATNSGSLSLGSLSTTVDDVLLVALYGSYMTVVPKSWTAPTGMTERTESLMGSSNTLSFATQDRPNPGNPGSKTAVQGTVGSLGMAGKLFAIVGNS